MEAIAFAEARDDYRRRRESAATVAAEMAEHAGRATKSRSTGSDPRRTDFVKFVQAVADLQIGRCVIRARASGVECHLRAPTDAQIDTALRRTRSSS